MWNKFINHKWFVPALLIAVLGIIYLSNIANKKFDLTDDKMYSLSDASKKVLDNIKEPVDIEVFLKGEFPAGFQRLTQATKEFLDDCNRYAHGKLNIKFINPFEGKVDSVARMFADSIDYFYDIKATIVGDLQTEVGAEQRSKVVIPGALVKANGKVAGVNLFKGTQQQGTDEEQLAALYNQVEVGLEYRFMEAISKVTNKVNPGIAYAIGHGEPGEPLVTDMVGSLQGKSKETRFNNFGPFNLAAEPYIPETVNTLIINKPTKPFTDFDKLKIDQFIMRGGSVFWAIDNMYAEIDSLFRSGDQGFVAYDRGLNLDDLLFTYGVRINQNLLQDLNADGLPIMQGNNQSGSKNQIVPFSFMPILNGTTHPITKNIDGVRAVFPNTIDTVNASNGIKKTILLKSSPNAKIIGVPYKVDFAFMQYANDKSQFRVKDTSVAVLLEGRFKSHFQDRLPQAFADSLKKYNRPFIDQATAPGKMVVVADGDIAMNGMNPVRGPLAMGENTYTRITYANKDFFMNCMSYLNGNEKLLQTRAKDFKVRMLDPVKKEKIGIWQFVTTVVPLLLLIVIGFIFYIIRKKKYSTLA